MFSNRSESHLFISKYAVKTRSPKENVHEKDKLIFIFVTTGASF